ncbi:MAG: hypothetical protein ACRDLT_17380 [Solirubrobacteraceae bacterium]
MSVWEIQDEDGFADLKLGDPREAVRRRFGTHRVFRRGRSTRETDQFVPSGIMVTYTADERVALIEVPPPSRPVLRGVKLLQRPLDDVLRDLRECGVAVVEDAAGANVVDWGVGLFAPDGVVEGVSIGS